MAFEYPTQKAIEKICKDLNLQKPDAYEQDWEYVNVDETRIAEFIDYYQSGCLDDETKFAVMIIIIGSFDDALRSGKFELAQWEKAKDILMREQNLHVNTIKYWSCEDEANLENCFCITPYIREIEKIKTVLFNVSYLIDVEAELLNTSVEAELFQEAVFQKLSKHRKKKIDDKHSARWSGSSFIVLDSEKLSNRPD